VKRRAALLAAVVVAGLCAASTAGAATPGDTSVFALVPSPGFPARAYVAPDGWVYEGTYSNPAGDSQRPRVLEYSPHGTLTRSWTIQGTELSGDHGVQVATSDSRGRLVLLNRAPARVLLLNTRNGRRIRYASFPDLPTCAPFQTGPHCSPALRDEPPTPDYAAWGPDGSLYVTDFTQAVIWRVPPGGGKPRIWLADRLLDGDMFGTTGIVLEPDGHTLLIGQQSSAGLADGDPTTGKLYEAAFRPAGSPGPLRQLWESGPVDGPDGFWIGRRTGDVYVALAGGNQIAVVKPDGSELRRFGAAGTGANGSPVPFDTPSSVMFEGRWMLVANQSFFAGAADPSNFAILAVYAGETGVPEFIPAGAGSGSG
jgi:sugar lactone lactonase YvrE